MKWYHEKSENKTQADKYWNFPFLKKKSESESVLWLKWRVATATEEMSQPEYVTTYKCHGLKKKKKKIKVQPSSFKTKALSEQDRCYLRTS